LSSHTHCHPEQSVITKALSFHDPKHGDSCFARAPTFIPHEQPHCADRLVVETDWPETHPGLATALSEHQPRIHGRNAAAIATAWSPWEPSGHGEIHLVTTARLRQQRSHLDSHRVGTGFSMEPPPHQHNPLLAMSSLEASFFLETALMGDWFWLQTVFG
jgi:hypothetical protein